MGGKLEKNYLLGHTIAANSTFLPKPNNAKCRIENQFTRIGGQAVLSGEMSPRRSCIC